MKPDAKAILCLCQRLLVFACLAVTCGLVQAQENTSHRVLLIYSSTDIGDWEQAFNTIILQQLAEPDVISVAPEFLSLVGLDRRGTQLKAESLQLQYGQDEVDLIITVFPEAASFVREFAQVISPDAGHLYVLPGSDVLNAELKPNQEVILQSSIGTTSLLTLQLAEQLLPDLEQIYLVGGIGEGDRSYMDRVLAAVDLSGIEASTTLLQGLVPDDLIAALEQAPERSAILLSTYDIDKDGIPRRTITIGEMLKGRITLPLFAMFDSQLGRGALGGNMSVASQYGEMAAELARNYLAGISQPSIVSAPTQYMFDGERLNAMGIDRSRLPEGSIILNDPPSFWRDNLVWIISAASIILVQLLLIALLGNAIRRRKQAENELKTTQKMEALGTLAGGIAHDFNNILMAIIANAELALMQSTEPAKTEQRLGNIVSASNRAKNLVSQILMFSRQSASRAPEPIDVCALLAESATQIRSFLPAQCTLRLGCAKGLPLVSADSGQLHQCILNISINAQHAMNNQGEITIDAYSCNLQAEKTLCAQTTMPAGDYVAIAISDTGAGISDQDRQKIFEPFFSTKPQGKGTGLGLALVSRIVRDHGGYIDVQSELGKGSTFTLYLNANSKQAKADTEANSRNIIRGTGEQVMLVDDDELVLEGVANSLARHGYRVSSFRSSVDALQSFKQSPGNWDLLFTDLSMPEMDGVRLSTQLRTVRGDLPVILYTGYLEATETSDLDRVRILYKPCTSEEITSAIAAELHRN